MKSIYGKERNLGLFSIIMISFFIQGCATTPSPGSEKHFLSELVKIKTRPGVTIKFIFIRPENPIAAVVLLEGGSGKLELASFSGKPMVGRSRGFLTRSREEFVKHGLAVALLDAPSDKTSEGMTPRFRTSGDHSEDISALVSYLKDVTNVPVWLVGMSRGTYSATNGAIHNNDQISGLVLVSSSTSPPKMTKGLPSRGILDMAVDKIRVPALIVAHKNDKCPGCPPSGAPKIKKALLSSPITEVRYFTGGKQPLTWECGPLSPHGYYGIEEQVISGIAEFIKSHS